MRIMQQTRKLYQTPIAKVWSGMLERRDKEILSRVSIRKAPAKKGVNPYVHKIQDAGYLIEQTGANFSEEYQARSIKWFEKKGFSSKMIEIIKAAQVQFVDTLIISGEGIFAEPGEYPKLPPLGRKKLSQPEIRRLLESLIMMHEQGWKLEILANILTPTLKKTAIKKPSAKKQSL